MENVKELNIYEKMLMITEEIGIIEKNLTVGTGTNKYKAVSERDVLDNVKPLEKKYRIYSYPTKRTIIDSCILQKETEYKGEIKKVNQQFMRTETTYRFINIDKPEEYIETTVYGDGIDTGDKAPGKAMTYADKYALMKAYKLSTGDDPDKEASPEKGYTRNVKLASEKQVTMLEQYYKGINLTKLLKQRNISTLKEMPMTDASDLIKIIMEKAKQQNDDAYASVNEIESSGDR